MRGTLAGLGMIAATCLVFLVCVHFTRPPAARSFAALLSGVPVVGVNIAADVLAYQWGWWRYPGVGDHGVGPVFWYVGAAIGVSGLTLIGWRVHRRWGFGGTIVFLLAFALYGSVRDWVVSQAAPDVIVFGDGALPWIADYAAWLAGVGTAVAVQALLRGPPSRDAPRPRRAP
jgi:hypothetical protein